MQSQAKSIILHHIQNTYSAVVTLWIKGEKYEILPLSYNQIYSVTASPRLSLFSCPPTPSFPPSQSRIRLGARQSHKDSSMHAQQLRDSCLVWIRDSGLVAGQEGDDRDDGQEEKNKQLKKNTKHLDAFETEL